MLLLLFSTALFIIVPACNVRTGEGHFIVMKFVGKNYLIGLRAKNLARVQLSVYLQIYVVHSYFGRRLLIDRFPFFRRYTVLG